MCVRERKIEGKSREDLMEYERIHKVQVLFSFYDYQSFVFSYTYMHLSFPSESCCFILIYIYLHWVSNKFF